MEGEIEVNVLKSRLDAFPYYGSASESELVAVTSKN